MPGAITIPGLDPDNSIEGTEVIPTSQSGFTKRITIQQIADFIIAQIGGGGSGDTLIMSASGGDSLVMSASGGDTLIMS